MSYPSIITQPGSAQRNVEPITQALSRLLDLEDSRGKSSGKPSDSNPRRKRRILEIGSGDCTHLQNWARRWEDVQWWPTGRTEGEVRTIDDILKASGSSLDNVQTSLRLDIGLEDSWSEWATQVFSSVDEDDKDGLFEGVLMVNIIHCCPAGYPENVFRHFSQSNPRPVLKRNGWIAAYSPFLADDGSYKSEGDEKFDNEYIKAKDDSLGLRTITSISKMARRWGFKEAFRRDMPKGNIYDPRIFSLMSLQRWPSTFCLEAARRFLSEA